MNALVNVPVCPLWVSPSAQSELADEVLYGMPAALLDQSASGWFRVQTYYGYTGYVQEENLLVGDDGAVFWAECGKKIVLHKHTCDVMSKPDMRSQRILCLPRGAVLHPAGAESGGWQPVRLWDGRTGYVRSSVLGQYWDRPASGDEETLRSLLVQRAHLYCGAQYRWGGKTPAGIDCSGLVSMAYLLCGVIIWRDAQMKEGYPVHEIDRRDLKRGDLLFGPGHVAMYLGDGAYIHSTGAPGSDGVCLGSLKPGAAGYRADLVEALTRAGSIF